jgi:3-hydroxyacyl-CoA dehydrogenase
MTNINKVAVIGGGVMGGGIAAILANAGIKPYLYEIAGKNSNNELSEKALEDIKQSPNLTKESNAERITPLNLEDHLNYLSECDWIVEAITEDLTIKHKLYSRIEPYLKSSAIISSNTSTIQLANLKQGVSENFANKFYITHFFNPPRHMKLLELVTPENAQPEQTENLAGFLSKNLGKGVVYCKDTPGFVANRIGCFLLESALRKVFDHNQNPAHVDSVFINLFGLPKTGLFGLYDLIGWDIMQNVTNVLTENLEINDRFNQMYYPLKAISALVDQGYTGKKGKGGFYQTIKTEEGRQKQVLDLNSFKYIPVDEAMQNYIGYNSIEELIGSGDGLAECVRDILDGFGNYVHETTYEISNSPEEVDKAIQLGFNWKKGPFALFGQNFTSEETGFNWLKNRNESKGAVSSELLNRTNAGYKFNFYKLNQILPDELLNSENLLDRSSEEAVLKEYHNSLVFINNNKLGVLTQEIFEALIASVDIAEEKAMPLIITSSGRNFSAGADLNLFKDITNESFMDIYNILLTGQDAMMKLKYARIPSVAAVGGVALGGGFELIIHSSHSVINMETQVGLVEILLGLVPGWGGTKHVLLAGQESGDINPLESMLRGYKTPNADYIAENYGRSNFSFNMNNTNLFLEAYEKAMQLSKNFQPKNKEEYDKTFELMPELKQLAADNFQYLSEYHEYVAEELLKHIRGRSTLSEHDLLNIERDVFLQLIRREEAAERINHMQQYGKPLL